MGFVILFLVLMEIYPGDFKIMNCINLVSPEISSHDFCGHIYRWRGTARMCYLRCDRSWHSVHSSVCYFSKKT